MATFQGSRLEGAHCTEQPEYRGGHISGVQTRGGSLSEYTFQGSRLEGAHCTEQPEYRGGHISGVQTRGGSLSEYRGGHISGVQTRGGSLYRAAWIQGWPHFRAHVQ